MIVAPPADHRDLHTAELDCDLAVVGGGLAGTCCALTAARAGARVVLIQDRPVLGGNASSEVRLWTLGATAHMTNNNRWAREGGVIDEILVENLYRNREGNPVLFDTVVLEKVVEEPNITLLLNTAAFAVEKSGPDAIRAVRAFCPQNSTMYRVRAPLFCDASGDGVVGFLAGAAFRMGAESADEFGEKYAPPKAYGELLGHTIYFYSKDTGRPVKFIPPSYALKDITKIPRYRSFNTHDHGCRYWWIEWGGRLDTVHDTEKIRWELWKVVYGVWDYIKNSGKFPDAANLTLEWVGLIPGKRESRRFEGDAMLTQPEIVERRRHDDDVSFGGWSMDLHPADGIYSPEHGCSQVHAKGIYPIPYRCLYSRNIDNLFLAGRIISVSHVAFSSTRVMATCAHAGQAAGMAAAICAREKLLPRDLSRKPRIGTLQRELVRAGQFIPGVALDDPDDLVRSATISASGWLKLADLPDNGPLLPLTQPWAMMLPVPAGPMPAVSFLADAAEATTLRVELRIADRPDSYTPERTLAAGTVPVSAGTRRAVEVRFDAVIDQPRYVFVCIMPDRNVSVRTSQCRVTGILAVTTRYDPPHVTAGRQEPKKDIGADVFEFWHPQRRPGGHNLAMTITPPLDVFRPENVRNGLARPTAQPNAWVADPAHPNPSLRLRWPEPRTIRRIVLGFDTDFDHPMESVQHGHPEDVIPFCVREYRIRDEAGRIVAECRDNHQTRNTIVLPEPVTTRELILETAHPSDHVPAAIFETRCYSA